MVDRDHCEQRVAGNTSHRGDAVQCSVRGDGLDQHALSPRGGVLGQPLLRLGLCGVGGETLPRCSVGIAGQEGKARERGAA